MMFWRDCRWVRETGYGCSPRLNGSLALRSLPMAGTNLQRAERGAAFLDSMRAAPQDPIIAVSIADLLAQEIPEPEHLLRPLLTKNSLSMVYSWRGIGKTWFSLSLAYAVASGGTYLRWEGVEPKKV